MSELPNRVSEIPTAVRPSPSEKPLETPSQTESSHLLSRATCILAFLLFVGMTVVYAPQIAKQIAYSWNIGVERAKAEVARQFLDDHPLSATEQRTAWVAKAVSPSVVSIHTMVTRPLDEYSGMRGGRGEAEQTGFDIGSGIIVDAQGYLLTNHHVIEGAQDIRVQLGDGRTVSAEIIGSDRAFDLAVLRIEADDLQAIDWGDSRQVTVGEQVLTIGSPYGLQQTITSGVISATDRYKVARTMRGPRREPGSFPHALLQTDAAINPGNSGGALVDMNGKLIGICTEILSTENGGNSGIGFAIPSFMAKRIYEEIVSHNEVRRGWIGVQPDDTIWYDAQQMDQERPRGAIIMGFPPRSPARAAGLRRWDIILRWGETEINSSLHLIHLVTLTKPGTKETVEVFRNNAQGGEILTFEITVGSRPIDL